MSILHARFRTNRALWGSLSVVLFVLLGFLDLMPEGKGSGSYWQMWSIFLSGEWICSTAEFIGVLMVHALIRAVPAVVASWVLQAIAVVGIAAVRCSLLYIAPGGTP